MLAYPCDPRLHEDYVASAKDYVSLAEEANGPIPRRAEPAYVWGAAHYVAIHMEWCTRMGTTTRARLFFISVGNHDPGDRRDHGLGARGRSLGADSGSLDLPVERHSRAIGKVGHSHMGRGNSHCNK